MSAAEPPKQPQGLPPIAVFVVVLILVAAGATFLLTRASDGAPKPTSNPTPAPTPTNHSLTDAEAIARFKELDRMRIQAFEQVTLNWLGDVFTPNSPEKTRAAQTIRQLSADAVLMRHRPYRTVSLDVARNDSREIELQQEVILDIRFVTSDGTDVTEEGGRERQTVLWTLVLVDDRWLIEEGEVLRAVSLNKK